MQHASQNRKRPAPGSSPVMQQSSNLQPPYTFSQMPDNADFSNLDLSFPTADQTFGDPNMADANGFAQGLNFSQPQAFSSGLNQPTSTDLVRRARSQQLASQNTHQEPWNSFGHASGQVEDEDEQDLDVKVALAKRDAQGKRKQIPPFVQKLSSFLDSNNTALIRWSDDGRSFIVLDEDEFARTLIPELFKHNNYASFVRQLNMYGFHKTVNITDGSLRQSEKARKGVKPPSMYSHRYFRKNRPDLLWLIQKPSNKSNAKRKPHGNLKDGYDSDDDRQYSPGPEGRPLGELGASAGSSELATMPRTELSAVRQELKKLQQQQNIISRMIGQLKDQNEQFYRQATAFQALHDRHENSINAILTFLATFYNRSLEGHAGQNLVNMFSNAGQTNQPQHGSVVEEFHDNPSESSNQVQRYVKRPQLLLPGPAAAASYPPQPDRAITEPNSARPSASPPKTARESMSSLPPDNANSASRPQATASPVVKTDAQSPNVLSQVPESDQMMSLINSVNATNANSPNTAAPAMDFSSALDHYQNANGNAPLTPQQRDDVLALMANRHGNDPSNNNALISPTPPTMPDLGQLKETQQQLELLTNMQKQQDEKVQDLHRRLQPLSPSGTIPGVGMEGADSDPFDLTGAPGDYNPDAFVNFDNNELGYDNDDDLSLDFGESGGDFDWNSFSNNVDNSADIFGTTASDNVAGSGNVISGHLEPQNGHVGGGRVESISSSATSPATNVNAIDSVEVDGQDDDSANPRKRARTSL